MHLHKVSTQKARKIFTPFPGYNSKLSIFNALGDITNTGRFLKSSLFRVAAFLQKVTFSRATFGSPVAPVKKILTPQS